MLRLTELKLPLDHEPDALRAAVAERLGVPLDAVLEVHVARRGYDARRKRDIHLVYTLDATVAEGIAIPPGVPEAPDTTYVPPFRARPGVGPRPVVIGAGPCGLMAALTLAEMGFRPIVLERGTIVRQRTKDTWALWRKSILTPESNVQFGEGGAGTFSDGKLYSGIQDKRHLGRKVMTAFVEAGAPEEILYVSKPHIGTFRLVTVVEGIRARIEALGG